MLLIAMFTATQPSDPFTYIAFGTPTSTELVFEALREVFAVLIFIFDFDVRGAVDGAAIWLLVLDAPGAWP